MNKLLKVLHVEDNPLDADLTQQMLSDIDNELKFFELTHVMSLREALGKLLEDDFAAILLDLHLPDAQGLEPLSRIREHYPDVPIVILTGTKISTLAIQALQEGAQEYMMKDYMNGEVLSQVIQSSIMRKKIENNLIKNANYDELTGLPNKSYLQDHARGILERASRWNTPVGVFFIDLDGFKLANDTYGHLIGDIILKEAAQRMQRALRSSDLVARYGGDEFVVVVQNQDEQKLERKDCQAIAEKILSAFKSPFLIGDNTIIIGCSIGIAVYPEDGSTLDELIELSDKEMYGFKAARKSALM